MDDTFRDVTNPSCQNNPFSSPSKIDEGHDVQLGRDIFSALTSTGRGASTEARVLLATLTSVLPIESGTIYDMISLPSAGPTCSSSSSLLCEDMILTYLITSLKQVVYLDADFKFDVMRFHDKFKSVAKKHKFHPPSVKAASKRLLVQRCANYTELLVCLSFKLPLLLKTNDVGLVVIDKITSFYWHDRSTMPHFHKSYEDLWGLIAGLRVQFPPVSTIVLSDNFFKSRFRKSHRWPGNDSVRTKQILVELGDSKGVCLFTENGFKKVTSLHSGKLELISSDIN